MLSTALMVINTTQVFQVSDLRKIKKPLEKNLKL